MNLLRGLVVLLLITLVFSACQTKYMTSAKVYIQQNNWEKAREQLLLEIESNPQNGEAYAFLAQAYEKESDYVNTGDSFTKAKELTPKDKKRQEIEDAQLVLAGTHIKRGNMQFEAEQFSSAADEYKIATQIYPEYLPSRHNLAIALLRSDDREGGKAAWADVMNMAEEGSKEWIEANNLLAKLAYQDSSFEEAIGYTDALLESDPDNVELLGFKAGSYDAMGNVEDALAVYTKVLEIDPENVDAWFNKGVMCDKLGDIVCAEEAFRMVSRFAPDDKDALYNLGILAIKNENWELAKTAYSRIVEIDPQDAAAWQNLAVAQAKLGDTAAAQESFEKSSQLKAGEE